MEQTLGFIVIVSQDFDSLACFYEGGLPQNPGIKWYDEVLGLI